MIKIVIAGATGWVGTALSRRILLEKELTLVGGLSRSNHGADLTTILKLEGDKIPLFNNVTALLDTVDFDILIDFTKPDIAKHNVISTLKRGKSVVLGTSGISDQDFEEIANTALEHKASVLAAGNFAITAVLLQKFAEIAARYVPNFEIIDYASATKVDAPSGTVAELAYRLSKIQQPILQVPIEQTLGRKDTRGATINGIQVHSLRLPGHVLGVDVLFGGRDEKLLIRHEAGTSADPYIEGVLMAVSKLSTFTGLRRGLDSIMAL